jgi:poly-gamma-glutamate capsule biosynthesis protein CapA/YwtB (metallophosphatase superfamily)
MTRGVYRTERRHTRRSGFGHKFWLAGAVVVLIVGGVVAYKVLAPTPVERAANQLQFDSSVSEAEKQAIRSAIQKQAKTYDGSAKVAADTSTETTQPSAVLAAYVPVTNVYATRQAVSKADLGSMDVYVTPGMDDKTRAAVAGLLELESSKLTELSGTPDKVSDTAVVFVPVSELSPNVKLLTFEGNYYLDSFQKGAVFRQAVFSGDGASGLKDLALNTNPGKDATLKVNMTGVTALTRVMMRKLSSVGDAKYFSKQIGAFLADADITHVSNEVSFKAGCAYSDAKFCAPPEMIETLKDSGVDLVELTGNHNNDLGNDLNTDSIKQYHSLGWHTFGGGLNTAEAAKPYIADKKNSKVTFLGYNFADGAGSGAIAGSATAGANPYNPEKVKADIAVAKQQGSFVIVDIQFWECYAYPAGYIEFPECDVPIGSQKETFRQVADMGADMVIGTAAHQPQTYEMYKGKPIYYGLGNLYFEQTQWPGTERGIILTHYFAGGKLLQTKLTPTVYGKELQTRVMDNDAAVNLLERLKTARRSAGL